MAATKTTNKTSEFFHLTREDNLLAAKRSVREHSHARIMRHSGTGVDIIDILVGTDIVERHICKNAGAYIPQYGRKKACIENMALYQ